MVRAVVIDPYVPYVAVVEPSRLQGGRDRVEAAVQINADVVAVGVSGTGAVVIRVELDAQTRMDPLVAKPSPDPADVVVLGLDHEDDSVGTDSVPVPDPAGVFDLELEKGAE